MEGLGRIVAGLACLALAAPLARARQAETRPSPSAELASRLAKHPFFSRVRFVWNDEHAPFLFLIESGQGASTSRAAEIARDTAALLEPVRQRFEEEVAEPLDLAPRDAGARWLVMVLASHSAYDAVAEWHFGARSSFDRELGAAILYEDPDEAREPAEHDASARHACVHLLEHAWYHGPGTAPVRSWMFEALAAFLLEGADGIDLAALLREFVADASSPLARWVHLRTIDELLYVDEPTRLDVFFQERTPDRSLRPRPPTDPWTAFYREGALFFAFLHDGEQGRYRAQLYRFLGRCLAGERDAQVFAQCFAPQSPASLQKAFLDWIGEQYARAWPGTPLDRKLLANALVRPPDPAPPDPAPAPAAASAARASSVSAANLPAPFRFEAESLTAEERFDRALAELGSGQEASARATFAELRAGASSELAARIEREERRLAAWIELRDRALKELADAQEMVEVDTHSGKLRLLGVQDGELLLEEKYGGKRRLALADADPLALARSVQGADLETCWARYYPYVLRDDARWKKLLKEDGGEGSALLADARADYPARLQVGEALVALRTLTDSATPTAEKELDERLALVRHVVHDLGDTSLVSRQKPALRREATRLLLLRLEASDPWSLLAGKVEKVGEGRVRLTYEFDDARELADFESRPYPVQAAQNLTAPAVKNEPFRIDGGRLVGAGRVSLRTLVELGSPLRVRYGLEFANRGQRDAGIFSLGVCDDGSEHFLWTLNLNYVQRLEPGAFAYSEPKLLPLLLDRVYPLELRHDGQRVSLWLEGKETANLSAGQLRSGALFLFANSANPVRLDRLEIEAAVLPTSLERLKKSWVERQLEGF